MIPDYRPRLIELREIGIKNLTDSEYAEFQELTEQTRPQTAKEATT